MQPFNHLPKTLSSSILLVVLCMLCALPILAQKPLRAAPTLGQAAPDFKLTVFPKGKGTVVQKDLASYHGKWLVLDFWSKTCIICIESMPKMDSLQKHFSTTANFLLVGKNDTRYSTGIEKMYQRIAKSEKLGLDVAFDTVSFDSYRVLTVPHIAIIDPQGKLVSVTSSSVVNARSLQALFTNRTPLPQIHKEYAANIVPNPLRRTLNEPIGNLPHRSWVEPWRLGDTFNLASNFATHIKGNRFITQRSSLARLYQFAHVGKILWRTTDPLYTSMWPLPLVEVKDGSPFVTHFLNGIGDYSYALELDIPSPTQHDFQKAMRNDLVQYFPYSAQIERRPMPVLALQVSDRQKLEEHKSKNAITKKIGDHSGFRLEKTSIPQLIGFISAYHPHQVIIDETGIGFDLDLALMVNATNLEHIRSALKEQGIELLEKKREMDVLVIKDR